MRAVFLPLAAAVTLGACIPPAAGWQDEPYGPVTEQGGASADGLRADLTYSAFSGDIWFQVSDPAHVALFVIEPGYGAIMVHPLVPGRHGPVQEGRHRLDRWYRPWPGYGGWGWAVGPVWRPAYFGPAWPLTPAGLAVGLYFAAGWHDWRVRGGSHPRYLFMVASRERLDTGRYRDGRAASRLRSMFPFSLMEKLAEELAGERDREDVAVATHVVWPDSRAAYAAPAAHRDEAAAPALTGRGDVV